jgi:hypothetical protein
MVYVPDDLHAAPSGGAALPGQTANKDRIVLQSGFTISRKITCKPLI